MIKKHAISTMCMIQLADNPDIRVRDRVVFRERTLRDDQAIWLEFKGIQTDYPALTEVIICTANLNKIIKKEFNLFERRVYSSYLADNFTEALLSFLSNLERDSSDEVYIKLLTLRHGETVNLGEKKQELTANQYKETLKRYTSYLDEFLYHETLGSPNFNNASYLNTGNIRLKFVKRFYSIIKDQMIKLAVN